MRAAVYEAFQQPLSLQQVSDPDPDPDGVVIRVRANGICRSDWHGWMGHDPGISLPHVPGHEMSGTIEALGRDVNDWKTGDRVTLPFVCGCGCCDWCRSGNAQVCSHQSQPGFTQWGAFAEFVAVPAADFNLVRLPESMDFVTAASLGCRFVTAYRALVVQGRVSNGQWVVVHGCGGVGLSAVQIASALGARVIGVDVAGEKLALARREGAEQVLNAREIREVPGTIREWTNGGAHVSLDALGSTETCGNSIRCLRQRGRHVQVGLMLADQRSPAVPMDAIIAGELEILGSHGMAAGAYGPMLAMVREGKLKPDRLVGRRVNLETSLKVLENLGNFPGQGLTVIDRF